MSTSKSFIKSSTCRHKNVEITRVSEFRDIKEGFENCDDLGVYYTAEQTKSIICLDCGDNIPFN